MTKYNGVFKVPQTHDERKLKGFLKWIILFLSLLYFDISLFILTFHLENLYVTSQIKPAVAAKTVENKNKRNMYLIIT